MRVTSHASPSFLSCIPFDTDSTQQLQSNSSPNYSRLRSMNNPNQPIDLNSSQYQLKGESGQHQRPTTFVLIWNWSMCHGPPEILLVQSLGASWEIFHLWEVVQWTSINANAKCTRVLQNNRSLFSTTDTLVCNHGTKSVQQASFCIVLRMRLQSWIHRLRASWMSLLEESHSIGIADKRHREGWDLYLHRMHK